MNKLLAILLLASLILNALLLSKDSEIGQRLRPAHQSVSMHDSQTEQAQNSGIKTNQSSTEQTDALSNPGASETLSALTALYNTQQFNELELPLRDFLSQYPNNQAGLMLEAQLIMQTQTLNYALSHYYSMLNANMSEQYYTEIQLIIDQQTTKVIQQLTADGSWEILATFLEPLLQIDPLNRKFIYALARAYGMQNQLNLMENTLVALDRDDRRALRMRQQINKRLQQLASAREPQPDATTPQQAIASDLSEQDDMGPTTQAIARLSENNQLITNIEVGNIAATMLLDTGASTTAIKKSIIDRLPSADRDFVGLFKVQTAGGAIQARLYTVANLTLGNAKFEQASVLALPDDTMNKFDGLLGMNILKAFEMTFDQDRQEMVLSHKPKA